MVHGAEIQGIKDALENACESGHETIVKYLMEDGVDVQGNRNEFNFGVKWNLKKKNNI